MTGKDADYGRGDSLTGWMDLPHGAAWVTGRNMATGKAFIALSNGQRVDIDPQFLAAICVSLAELAPTDPYERAEVAEAWDPDNGREEA